MDYIILSETKKAIKVKYPYYEVTNEYKKTHKQKHVEQWVPKAVTDIERFIFNKMVERGFAMRFIKLGIAPIKVEIEPLIIPDDDKKKAKWDIFYKKVFDLTGCRPHHRDGFDADEACFIINDKTFDFGDEWRELKNYNPTIYIKQYK